MKYLPALALFCLLTPSIQAQEPALQADWFQSPTTGNWYGVDYTERTWSNSEALAVSLGGHLATIRNGYEQKWIEDTFEDYVGEWGFWCGFNDVGPDGTWVWSSGDSSTYTNWDTGQGGTGGENYCLIWGTQDPHDMWIWHDAGDPHPGVRPILELPTKPQVGWSWPKLTDTSGASYPACLADFDKDGLLDYVACQTTEVAIYLNKGGGYFELHSTIGGFTNVYGAIAIDHDQDNDQDLVICDFGGAQLVLAENLAWSSTPSWSTQVLLNGVIASDVCAITITPDSIPDIAVVAFNSGPNIFLFSGNQGGGFTRIGSHTCPEGAGRLITSDFNADGQEDLFISGYANPGGAGGHQGDITIALSDGSGGLQVSSLYVGQQPGWPSAADIDGDGDYDVVVPREYNDTYLTWTNDGLGTLDTGSTEVFGCGDGAFSSLLEDSDMDGDPDLLIGCLYTGRVRLYENDGAGNFQYSQFLYGHNYPSKLLAADVNDDQHWDLIVNSPNAAAPFITTYISNHTPDCNGNGIPDTDDIVNGTSSDCDGDGVPDECQIADDPSLDCDWNSVLDTCDLAADPALDCDGDEVLDSCQIDADPSLDCDGNGVLDTCDLLADPSLDCDGDNVLDSCQITWDPGLDCDGDQVLDSCQLFNDPSLDCDGDNVIDSCQIAGDPSLDQNSNDILDSCECAFENYCQAAWNSSGGPAVMGALGTASLTANDLTLTASGVPQGQFGLFFYGAEQDFFMVGFGAICVKPPLFRLDPVVLTDGAGTASLALDLTSHPFSYGNGQVAAFETWHFQFWFRDPQAFPADFNFSDGLAVTFCP